MQLYSVNNFEVGTVVRPINSPRSLEACLRCGLDPSELLPKNREHFVEPGLTDKMIDIKFDTYERKRKTHIELVTKERDAIIGYNDRLMRRSTSPGQSPLSPEEKRQEKKSATLELEEKRLEALRKRQKDEIEKLIQKERAMVVLQQKIAHAEEEEVKKKKLHDKKVAEQKILAARKAQQILLERQKKEEEESEHRRMLDRKEKEHSKKIQEEKARLEREMKQQARERDIERAEKIEAHRKQTEALIDHQFRVAEENRLRMIEREERVQRQLLEKKEAKAKELQAIGDAARKRMTEALTKHEETQEKKKHDFYEKESKALELAKEHQKEREIALKKQSKERDIRNQLRFQRLVDAYKLRKQRRAEIIQRRSEKDHCFDAIQEERNEKIAMLRFSTNLKLQEKEETVERVARMNEFRRLQMMRKIEQDDENYERIQLEKELLKKKHLEEAKQTLIRKHEVTNAMETMRITNDFSLLDQLFAGKKGKKNHRSAEEEGANERTSHTA